MGSRRDRSPLFLGGFMASGKTSVGKELSRLTGIPFLDVDQVVEQRTGRSIREIFSRSGEAEFRRLEKETILEIGELGECVVALGGGSLVDCENRRVAESRGTLVILDVQPATVRKRAASQPGARPLLEGEGLEDLWEARRNSSGGGCFRIDTDSLSVEEVAARILEALKLFPRRIRSGERSFPGTGGGRVVVGEHILERLPSLLGENRDFRPFAVADSMTGPLFGERLGKTSGMHLLPRGEAAKTLDNVLGIYGALARSGVDRHGILAALGGGVVGDTAGFAAATWMRGISLVQCPTTLLAMVDSAMGGKVGVNLPEGKNLVGAFHQPALVVSDVSCLRSLSRADYRQGLGEMVKYGLGEDFSFFSWMEEHVGELLERDSAVLLEAVSRCTGFKLAVVAEDENESTGARARLNLGHTVGHAMEAAGGFRDWRHGDAVAAGLVVATRLACRLGDCGEGLLHRLVGLLDELEVPWRPDRPWHELLSHLSRDKKFQDGKPRLVLPLEGSRCRLRKDVDLSMLGESYEEVRNWKAE